MDSTAAFKLQWVDYLRTQQLSDRTIAEYSRYLHHFDLNKISPDYFTQWISANNNKVARAFIIKLVEFLVNERYIEGEMALQLQMYKVPKIRGRQTKKQIRILTKDEVNAFADSIDNKRCRLMVLTTFYLGLRRRELLGLRFRDFDFNKDVVYISHTTAKGRKSRTIPLSSYLRDEIVYYITARPIHLIEAAHETNAIFFNRSIAWWDKKLRAYSRLFFGYSVKPHDLRHSCGTYLRRQGLDLQEIASFLGHDQIETTKIYVKLSQADIKNKVQQAFA